MKNQTKKITLSAMFIALGSILAIVFHSFDLGAVLSPMHFTVLIAGITLGYKYGLAVGIITPLINSIVFSMPPLFPVALGMALELGTYGLVIGLIYTYLKPFKLDILNIYFSLIISMIAGRLIFGVYNGFLLGISEFGFDKFITAVIIVPLPGIIIQLLTIPAIVHKKIFFEN